ncbi:PDDEXK nuclease domain-containing protein [Pasteurella atlantica]|uniref:PDDEXK nuclease domain-containing protein n=1 Tax=Pasteurellaceae TaxID=712 RepID=UPI00276AA863|nr:PDDEXK nuclease domain-containing protein [Pasteurella atlantica]MDP8032888.1 PDDEXK nuclease domain-containing protein [Pasteurella atlantica]MDP8034955.1 PDDEXK nuclease domain-containing protein [Pasteurella atlantica]MDP8036775.1 PDDEXK nuclease domain-containing protein [Pasteurella atlantica]MDP8047252.1 PDDEXK nuclease domain-containing protein [Pasteurella atlantica]MDP8049238.1 PDDEXK nuclease domain-containing protein [Pasteurella atlantica]
MKQIQYNKEYINWLKEIKASVRKAQVKTALVANASLIEFYCSLGKMISQKNAVWGSKFLQKLSEDLREEFPEMKGFSVTNLKYCKQFYEYLLISPQIEGELENQIGQQLVDQLQNEIRPQLGDEITPLINNELYQKMCCIPWGHIKHLIGKVKNTREAIFYIQQTIENSWSREVLALQIKSDLYSRQGKAITNFQNTLPSPQSDLAEQTIKDPYRFDFLDLSKSYNERDIELQLIEHISKFLLELGKGFAFIGRQYHIEVDETDYYMDLLFYHTRLKCYVVIELKNTKFKPEYAGKLNFYLSAVDSLIKANDDKPTIGILLCRDKKKIETEFALRGMSKPIGVSEFTLTETLPDNLKSDLPTIEELEQKLNKEIK